MLVRSLQPYAIQEAHTALEVPMPPSMVACARATASATSAAAAAFMTKDEILVRAA